MPAFLPALLKILAGLPWPKIIEFIMTKFGHKDEVKQSLMQHMPENMPQLDWMEIARKELGVKEIKGDHQHNERILAYHQATSLKATSDEVPWCAAFVSWVLERSGIPSMRSARARDYEHFGDTVSKRQNAIVVLWRGNPNSSTGHVGFYVGDDPKRKDHILVLGGNQSDSVNISSYPEKRVLSYHWPLEV